MMELQGKQNAIEKIEQLFIRMDFSKIPMFDDSVIKRIDQIREILTSFHNKWNDIIKTSLENAMKKTKITNENDTRFTKMCQSIVYIIILDSETSNLQLTEFIQSSLVTSDLSKTILDTLGQSFHIMLENLHYILNSYNGDNLETDIQWVLSLLLYSSQFARKTKAGNLAKCLDELVNIWFLVMEKQVNNNRQNIQWDKIISYLQVIFATLSKDSDAFLSISNLIMNEIWTNPERERFWDPAKSSPKIISELKMNIQRELSVLKTTELIVDKNKSFVDRKVVYRPRLKLYRKNWTFKKQVTNELRNKNSWQFNFANSETR
ncbi:hypothetical protein GLOIN_2v1115132 [Rhizophagus irregularis DAOM 181602=DAOM 197198]|uniref:Uncharacterized protein n=1 Tax=Rhizophagus irregularis (strain DAOM 181602 / DAOM 197198 / MUCL 43194) TaxID=747089 RepID=U9T1F1_RHIID|nr:hypothetical protein GLOIN_2v1115132 [Rhizophagus irregularis DAOM 181602=DAOM 197198]POG73399.1 hypothetical protein GLOIN_2v1115132 [Rhizophagus irregularis DAOM 181602=DAOM 197198]|eukprot:XP_025180265.1 hypothetical protein GLOIN_2v1115132 [Rhizophagus irregularis DAOM 181602=DAOM 197198]